MISDPPVPERKKPVEALQPCEDLPNLPENLPQMELEEALKEVIRVKRKGDEIFMTCRLRHQELVRFITE